MVLLETLSAELMTLPLILMTFSQLSVIALAANLLIVPLVPLAMLLSAAAGAAGM
jgi:competence protein ComEC